MIDSIPPTILYSPTFLEIILVIKLSVKFSETTKDLTKIFLDQCDKKNPNIPPQVVSFCYYANLTLWTI